ncbi:uncharacterized [Tachysurus ichikawai]
MKGNNANCCNLFRASQQKNTVEAAFCSAVKSSAYRDTSCRSPATPICTMPSQRENKKKCTSSVTTAASCLHSDQPCDSLLGSTKYFGWQSKKAGRILGESLHCQSHSQGRASKWGSVKCETPSSLPVLQTTKSIIRAVTRTDESPMLKPN